MQEKFDAKIRKSIALIDELLPLSVQEVSLADGYTRKQTLSIVVAVERMMTMMYAIKNHASLDVPALFESREQDPVGFEFELNKLSQAERFVVMTMYDVIGHPTIQTDAVPFRQVFTRLLKAKQALCFSDEERDLVSSLLSQLEGHAPVIPDASQMMVKYHFRYEPIIMGEMFSGSIAEAGAQANMSEPEFMVDALVYMIGHRRYGEKFDALLEKANAANYDGVDAVLLKMINQIYARAYAKV
jgi:hypothetical protein